MGGSVGEGGMSEQAPGFLRKVDGTCVDVEKATKSVHSASKNHSREQ